MNIGRICQRDVVTIRPDEDLTAAARLMREKHVGYLVVTEPGSQEGREHVVGVITDRDVVVAVVAREVDPRDLKVSDVMTRDPLVANVGDPTDVTLRRMRSHGVRRVPVVDTAGWLAGVLSLDDVLDAIAEQLSHIAGSIRNEQQIERKVRN